MAWSSTISTPMDCPFLRVVCASEIIAGSTSGIVAFHIDYKPFDRTVASLSLLSQCVMTIFAASGCRVHEITFPNV